MHFLYPTALGLVWLATTLASSTGSLAERQVAGAMETQNLVRAQTILNTARSDSTRRMRGRVTLEVAGGKCVKVPTTDCSRCMNAILVSAVGAISACGVASLGVAALGGPAGGVLAAAGFLTCDVYEWGQFEKGLVECRQV